MADLYSVNIGDHTVYKHDGFSTTILDSFSGGAGGNVYAMTWDDSGNIITGQGGSVDKFFQYSGFSSTVSDSFSTTGFSTFVGGACWYGGDLYCGSMVSDEVFKLDGFSSTVLSSFSTSGYSAVDPTGITTDGTDWYTSHLDYGSTNDAIYKLDGFSTTVLSSFSTNSYDTRILGVVWDTTNSDIISSGFAAGGDFYFHDGFSTTISSSFSSPGSEPSDMELSDRDLGSSGGSYTKDFTPVVSVSPSMSLNWAVINLILTVSVVSSLSRLVSRTFEIVTTIVESVDTVSTKVKSLSLVVSVVSNLSRSFSRVITLVAVFVPSNSSAKYSEISNSVSVVVITTFSTISAYVKSLSATVIATTSLNRVTSRLLTLVSVVSGSVANSQTLTIDKVLSVVVVDTISKTLSKVISVVVSVSDSIARVVSKVLTSVATFVDTANAQTVQIYVKNFSSAVIANVSNTTVRYFEITISTGITVKDWMFRQLKQIATAFSWRKDNG